ncbi:MAG TPA: alpha/beta hydrolase [Gemmatimonadales bacterium]|nr:alpha/beta hydrolase [Gemmatimonadales bacterium]
MAQPETVGTHFEATFRTADGLELFRQQWRPVVSPRAILVNVHGIGDHSGLYPMLPDYFVPRGLAVHAFDMRGNGRSPGPRGHIDSWTQLRDDLQRFVAVVRAQEDGRPMFLLGNSLGGLVVLDYALHHPAGLRGVIAIAPPLGRIGTPAWLLTLGRIMSHIWPGFTLETGLDLSRLSRDPAACEAIVTDPLFHRKGSARLAAEVLRTAHGLHERAGDFPVPLLLLHGAEDRMVFPDGTREFFGVVGQPDKRYVEYPGAFHALLADLDRDRVLSELESWMDKRRA